MIDIPAIVVGVIGMFSRIAIGIDSVIGIVIVIVSVMGIVMFAC